MDLYPGNPRWEEEMIDEQDRERQRESSSPENYLPPVRLPIPVVEYDPAWPDHFERISQKLRHYLDLCHVRYHAIDHVGSTAVPGLVAKANIDIIIEVPDETNAEAANEVLTYEPPPEEHYKCIGDGGIRGRISMKLHDRSSVPAQSIYIINKEDPEGRAIMRCHRALRDTLRLPQHESLKLEYGQVKIELASSSRDSVEYGQKKNPTIRRILRAAGWTEVEIDQKEELDYRVPGDDDRPY